jgi:hypothetical protein
MANEPQSNVGRGSVVDLSADERIKRLSSIFGSAQLFWKSSQDAEIPQSLRAGRSDEPVLVLRCEKGLAALVATDAGVHELIQRNSALRQGLRSLWDSGFIFWVRAETTGGQGISFSRESGLELVHTGLVPVATKTQSLVDHEGPLLPLESLDLVWSIQSETAQGAPVERSAAAAEAQAPTQAVEISTRLMYSIRAFVGNATIVSTSSADPMIPAVLRPKGGVQEPALGVVTIYCEQGLGAVIIEPSHLERVQNLYPVLRTGPMSCWQGSLVVWVRFDLDAAKPLLGSESSVSLCDGAVFIGQGFVPIAPIDPDSDLFAMRQGQIPYVHLVREKIDPAPGTTPPECFNPGPEEQLSQNPTSEQTASAAVDLLQELRAVFGEDRVIADVRAEDPQVPPELAALVATSTTDAEPASSHHGVLCGPRATGHLVALAFSQASAIEGFRNRNPKLFCIGTVWGSLSMIWLMLEGPVPRTLHAGSMVWIAAGLVPVTLEALTPIRFLQPGARIPLTRFDQIRWDQEVVHAFNGDLALQECGEPFLPVRRREFVLNNFFLSEVLLNQLELVFDLNKNSFTRYNTGTGTWSTLSHREVVRLVAERLIRLALDFPRQLPPGQVNKSGVQNLVWLMEVKGSTEIPTAKRALELFFNELVEASGGAVLTQEALFEAFVAYCRLRRFPMSSRAYFDKAATKRFGKTSHCFGENGSLRGRVGWRLKQDIPTNPAVKPNDRTNNHEGRTPTSNV